jgi:hypothetical protein
MRSLSAWAVSLRARACCSWRSAIVQGDVLPHALWAALQLNLDAAVAAHAAFARTVLPSTQPPACPRACPPPSFSGDEQQLQLQLQPPPQGEGYMAQEQEPAAGLPAPCALRHLRGHEGSLLPLVADYLGLPRGRRLRHLREVTQCLRLLVDEH